jgi:transposase InsO family protein
MDSTETGTALSAERKFKATMDLLHFPSAAVNLLARKFDASAPNQIWLSDFSYIPAREGWLYLAGHKGFFTEGIAGYAVACRILGGKSNNHDVGGYERCPID